MNTIPHGTSRLSAPEERRILVIPADFPRSTSSHFVATLAGPFRIADLKQECIYSNLEDVVSSVAAWLWRHTDQATIPIDVFSVAEGATSSGSFDVEINGDDTIEQIADRLRPGLAVTAKSDVVSIVNPSNVAATILLNVAASSSVADLLGDHVQSIYDLNIILFPDQDVTSLMLAYNSGVFAASTIERLAESACVLLQASACGRTTVIGRLPLLSPAQVLTITQSLQSPTAAYSDHPVHRVFQALAKLAPEARAVRFRDSDLTYEELDERSNRLSHHLAACGVAPGTPVAVCLEPSFEIVIAILAIWKARGLYLPLDPTHPEAVVRRMLDEAIPLLVLTSSRLAALTEGFPQFFVDRDSASLERYASSIAPVNEPSLNDPAYLFYTSGTTGKPKGVIATHGNLAQYIYSAAHFYGFSADDSFVSVARYTFSISMFELISPLCCGGSLLILERDVILTPERFCRALEEVTVLHAGPSLLGTLFRYLRSAPASPRNLPRMRHASSGGDMVPPAVMDEMKRVFPAAELFVIYGSTEISCMGTTYAIPRDVSVARNMVGKPFPNVGLLVLDAGLGLVPFGVVGEICFAGPGVVAGYFNMPELAAEKFSVIDGRHFYRTGDLGRLHPDGVLEILGRRDFQVKVRGIRVELAAVEKAVVALGLATQCVVVVQPGAGANVRLIAFIVEPGEISETSFRQILGRELPDYMLPHQVVAMDALPLTANGKVDRNRLKEMSYDSQRSLHREPELGDELERRLAGLMGDILGVTGIGIEDNFFDLGGDSLQAVVLLEQIEGLIGAAVPPDVLFASGTTKALADHIRTGDTTVTAAIPLNSTSASPSVFMLSGIHVYRELAERLDGKCAAYGVFAPRELAAFDTIADFPSIEALARDYIEIIRRRQPSGPYRLLGYSFAGFLAYECAQQLQAAGEEVCFLAMLDSYHPEWLFRWKFWLSRILRLRTASPSRVAAYVSRRFLERSGLVPPDPRTHRADRQLSLLERRREEASLMAAKHYIGRLKPFAGKVLLIVSGDRLRQNPFVSKDCGWGNYIKSIEIHSVDTDHFRMLTEDPYLSEMAELVAARI